jgi:hypothetical protein
LASTATATAQGDNTLGAIEYYYADFNSYFVTAQPDEIVKLDNGVFAGWARTGLRFKVNTYRHAGQSHRLPFLQCGIRAEECTLLYAISYRMRRTEDQSAWIFEGEVFAVPGSGADGSCEAGTVPVYRLYNNGEGGAPNHRYTMDGAVRDVMIAAWVDPRG